jgi:virginiamycin B lyase
LIQGQPPAFGLEFTGTGTKFAESGASLDCNCAGPDGNIWFGDYTSGNGVWAFSPAGAMIHHYTLASAEINGICVGPDGNLWAADNNAAAWRITPAGVTTKVTLAGVAVAICAGPDGNLWCTTSYNGLYKITPASTPVATNYTFTAASMNGICAGPDGNLWIGCAATGVVKFSPISLTVLNTYVLGADTGAVCVSGDGNLFVTDYNDNATPGAIRKITTDGTVLWTTSLAGSLAFLVCAGPDGNAYVADLTTGNGIWCVNTNTGVATKYVLASAAAAGVCVGPDGNIWVGDSATGAGAWVMPFTLLPGSLQPSLPVVAGVIGANVTLTSATNILVQTTGTLAVGVWLVNAYVLVQLTAAGLQVMKLIAGTATCTFAGPHTSTQYGSTTSFRFQLDVTCIVTVTVPGTLTIYCEGAAGVAEYIDGQYSLPATGYSAVKIG